MVPHDTRQVGKSKAPGQVSTPADRPKPWTLSPGRSTETMLAVALRHGPNRGRRAKAAAGHLRSRSAAGASLGSRYGRLSATKMAL